MTTKKVTIIDYNCGNILSLKKALEACNTNVDISRSFKHIQEADRLVLPGVGAFGHCIDKIREFNLYEPICEFLKTERPILGICVGMQMLLDQSSEHGNHDGFGYIRGNVEKIIVNPKYKDKKVPFIGWANLTIGCTNDMHNLLDKTQKNWFYFVHSYYSKPLEPNTIIGTYQYYDENITALISKNNIVGCQFHPEKSGLSGLEFLNRFLRI